MSRYADTIRVEIAKAGRLDRTDSPTVALVEVIMRMERNALNGLTARQFTKAARQALADAEGHHQTGQLHTICDAYQLTVPAWAA